MFPDILNILVAGLLAGFFFSMPVAGPVSILITSNALEGKLRYCQRTAIGASIVEFIYVFIVIVGIKGLYTYYKPFIPYLLIFGSVFVLIASIRILKTKFDLDKISSSTMVKEKENNKGGLRAGFILNITNPSLFIGWLASSFIVFSFMSSIGLSTGGLDLIINENVSSVSEMAGSEFQKLGELKKEISKPELDPEAGKSISTLILATVYAAGVAIGGFIWLFYFSKLLVRFRHKFNIKLINHVIRGLGVILFGIGIYLGYKAVSLYFTT